MHMRYGAVWTRNFWRFAAACLALVWLGGCASSVSNTKKVDAYGGSIASLAVVIAPFDANEAASKSFGSGQEARSAVNRVAGTVAAYVPYEFPQAFLAAGVQAAYDMAFDAANPKVSVPGASHLLLIQPQQGDASCNAGGRCLASVRLQMTLIDLQLKRNVWTGQMVATDTSALTPMTEAAVQKLAQQTVAAMRADGLLPNK